MTANEVIYQIKQDRKLTEIWGNLTRNEKEEVVERIKLQTIEDIEKVLIEVKTGQNRLF